MRIPLKALLVILLSGSCWAANYTVKASGNWNQAATWGGTAIPGNGDTVNIRDGLNVTVSDARIIGVSGPNGTVALEAGNTGALIIASGGKLQVRGDIEFSSAAGVKSAYLTVQAGGLLEWDSSQAAAPLKTSYSAHPDSNFGFRTLVTTGTKASHASVRSTPGGGHGYFGLGGHLIGGNYVLTYTDFVGIGDASHPAFQGYNSGQKTQLTAWDSTHNTFTSCGLAPLYDGSMIGEDVFRHDYNVHSDSLGHAVMHRPGDDSQMTPLCTAVKVPVGCAQAGVREMVANVFDIFVDEGFDARDFTIHSNYFGDRMGFMHTNRHSWWYFQNNFYRDRDVRPTDGGSLSASGDVRDNIFFLDDPSTNNPHVINLGAARAATITGNVFDHTGDIHTDSGEFVLVNVLLAPQATYSVKNNILLPNAGGHASTEIVSVMQCCGNLGNKFVIDHNTYFGERSPNLNQDAVHTAEGGPNPSGQLDSFRSNLLWAYSPNSSYKLLAQGKTNTDVCAPERCDYNNGWNTRTDGSTFVNGARGYADNFTKATGVHDRSANPNFVDPTRNTATFDSAYLGHTAAAWSGNATYKRGDFVSSSEAAIYKGALINYRYVNARACANANPTPGLYTAQSRACWEWASLYRIRQAVAAQTLHDDQTIGAHQVDIITVLLQWIRAGYSPSNHLLALAGHDGQDIGAVPVSFAPPKPPGATAQQVQPQK